MTQLGWDAYLARQVEEQQAEPEYLFELCFVDRDGTVLERWPYAKKRALLADFARERDRLRAGALAPGVVEVCAYDAFGERLASSAD